MNALGTPARPATVCSYCGREAKYEYLVRAGRPDARVLQSACERKSCVARLWDFARWRWSN